MGYQRRVHGDCSTARTHLESTCPQSPTTRSSPKKRLPRRLLLRQRPLRRQQRKQKNKKAFECTDQRVKSKTSWCSYLLYNRKISDTLEIKIEKAQIHSIPKNLIPSRIFKNVQMTKPPDFLDQ